MYKFFFISSDIQCWLMYLFWPPNFFFSHKVRSKIAVLEWQIYMLYFTCLHRTSLVMLLYLNFNSIFHDVELFRARNAMVSWDIYVPSNKYKDRLNSNKQHTHTHTNSDPDYNLWVKSILFQVCERHLGAYTLFSFRLLQHKVFASE